MAVPPAPLPGAARAARRRGTAANGTRRAATAVPRSAARMHGVRLLRAACVDWPRHALACSGGAAGRA
jgi:hypothetical protein